MVLTHKQKREFIQNGFVILPKAVPSELIQTALDFVDEAFEDHRYHQNGMVRRGSAYPTQGFYKGPKSDPAVMDLFNKTDLMEACEELLGKGNATIRRQLGQIAFNSPSDLFIAEGRDVDEMVPKNYWHIDAGHDEYEYLGADFDIIVGVALSSGQEIDESRGQLCVWPGSHMLTHPVLSEQVRNRDPEDESKLHCKKIDIGFPVRMLLEAGDVCIAHQRLAHCPGSNMSEVTRKNIYFRIVHAKHDEIREQHLLDPLPFTAFEGIKNMVRKITARAAAQQEEQAEHVEE